MYRIFFIFLFSLFLITGSFSVQASAQEENKNYTARAPERIHRPMIAIDPMTLKGEGLTLRLWGIKTATTREMPLELKALDLMDRLIGSGEKVNCKVMSGRIPELVGRCLTQGGDDLALALLGHGYAVVDRGQTYNTVFANAYAQAQETARLGGKGVWQFVKQKKTDAALPAWLKPYTGAMLPVVLLGVNVIGFLLVMLVVYAGLARIGTRQEKGTEATRRKEAGLQVRERKVLLSTLEGELMENKDKVEAFLAIYNDMLRDLKDPDETPKYQQVGDSVQKYPNFSRIVFDANVNKLSLLDVQTAGVISKLYARLPRDQEYINLEPEVPLDTAVKLVEKVVQDAAQFKPAVDHVLSVLRTGAADDAA